ncbi:hypothetical protein BD769DRAFT_1390769 [Suillus cothurnatus]|nr:hypothetical protein BD769DRAFT_1390769 [Suillus cothurnatus]
MYSGIEDSIASFIGLNSDYYFTSWTQGFGCPSLVSLRLGLSVADLCWKLCKDPEMQAQCGQVSQGLLAAISPVYSLDIRSVFYEVAQLLLPGSLQDLSDEAQAIRDTLTPHLSSLHGYPVIVSTSQVRICIG